MGIAAGQLRYVWPAGTRLLPGSANGFVRWETRGRRVDRYAHRAMYVTRQLLPCEGESAFLSSFTRTPQVGTGAKKNILTPQSDQLRDPQSCLYGNKEKYPISAASPRALIGCCQKSLYLGPCQKVNLLAVVSLRRESQGALRQGA